MRLAARLAARTADRPAAIPDPGHRLSVARVGTYTWTADTKVANQWLRDGKAIRGATGATCLITRTDSRHRISVRLTGTKAGYTTATRSAGAVFI